MGGGLLQLVAYGAQDAYLTGNPHITFWKVLYKRHTNFSIEAARINLQGAPAYGQRVVIPVERKADLIWKAYVEITLPDTTPGLDGSTNITWNNSGRRLGYLMLKQIELEIGGQIIDRHYGEWLYLWETLTADFDTAIKTELMVNGGYGGATTDVNACGGRPPVLYVPLQFWFNRNPGLALPLIALQYHEVKFNIVLADAIELVSATAASAGALATAASRLPPLKEMAMYLDYIYLDVEERRRFAQETHEYLIEQLQFEGQQQINTLSDRLDLTLNHPVKELVWVFQQAAKVDCTSTATGGAYDLGYMQPFSYSDVVNRCRLQINGIDRFDERYGDYFWKVQPFQHHTGGAYNAANVSGSALVAKNTIGGTVNPINVYSFALKPEEHQPTGTCNFSRIDTATLVFDSKKSGGIGTYYPTKNDPCNFRIYALNYNIFRIMSGMGGLAYSN